MPPQKPTRDDAAPYQPVPLKIVAGQTARLYPGIISQKNWVKEARARSKTMDAKSSTNVRRHRTSMRRQCQNIRRQLAYLVTCQRILRKELKEDEIKNADQQNACQESSDQAREKHGPARAIKSVR